MRNPDLMSSNVSVKKIQLHTVNRDLRRVDSAIYKVFLGSTRTEVPSLGYIFLSEGVDLRSAIEDKYIFTYLVFPNIYTFITEYHFQKPLHAYC